MYLEHFGFSEAPFSLTPNTRLFHALPSHYLAIQTVLSAIEMGEGIIKVTGEVGTGKTMVCRMLINQLPSHIALVYLPNPALNGEQLRQAIASELGVNHESDRTLVDAIQQALLTLRSQGKTVVVLVDEAQALSDDALEALRLFGNLETEQYKLLQIVLLGQPELDDRLAENHLRQFRQRITFSATIEPLTLDEAVAYIDYRVEKVTIAELKSSGSLFSLSQKKAIWKASKGIPRLVNQICHKALLLSASAQLKTVHNQHLMQAMNDTYDALKPRFTIPMIWGWSQ